MANVPELNLKVNLSYGNDFLQDDHDSANQLMFVFWGILIPIIGFVGIIGNILTMVVLFRREMKSITVYFLRTLVVTDTAIIVSAFLGLSMISITQRYKELWMFTDVAFPKMYTAVNYVGMTLQMINVWATVAVSVERFIAICHPFRSVYICKKRNAYILISIIVVVSMVYNIPRFFATSYTTCGNNCFSVISTDFGTGTFYESVYSVYLYLILIYILPLALLGFLNTSLIVELMRMSKRRTVNTQQESTEANMSKVLVLIVVVFICCQSPGLVAQFTTLNSNFLLKWICVSNTLVVVNSSVNFLIYTAVGRKFRRVLLKTFNVLICIKRPVNEFRSSYSQNGGTEMTRLTSAEKEKEAEDVRDEKKQLNGNAIKQ